ncbi:MAG: hypothetical protein ACFB4I_07215 [Cyanophyceae cyanobacterium]
MKKIFALKKRQIMKKACSVAYPLTQYKNRPGIFMWHHGRCGSTVLGKLLDQHPDINWRGEIFELYAVHGIEPLSVEEDIKYVRAIGSMSGLQR